MEHTTQQDRPKHVTTPSHYVDGAGEYELLTALEIWNLGWCASNCIKYLFRAGKKTQDPLEDLQKAQEYLHRLVQIAKARAQTNFGDETIAS